MVYLIEETENGQKAYKALKLEPKNFSVLNSELAQKIIDALSKNPSCAMDLSRRLKEHEQKIYYHLRRLERSGIVKLDRTEERVGATAKIYSVSHPYAVIRLFDGDHIEEVMTRAREIEFFKPFIEEGKLNATIVVGSPDAHGRYGAQSFDGSVGIDLALFLGTFLKSSKPNYKLDTQMSERDMKGNLILIGGPKANIVIDKFNRDMPIFFDDENDFNVVSSFTNQVYSNEDVGIIIKMKNPLDESGESYVLVLSGIRFKGTRAAIMALIKRMKDVQNGNTFNGCVARVVRGIDKDADGIVDDVEFLE